MAVGDSEDMGAGDQRGTTEAERSKLVVETVGTSENLQLDEMDGEGAKGIECSCCYREYQSENTVQCGDGHLICFECIEKQVNEILYGGLRAHGSLSCISIGHCKESIPLSEIRKAIANDVVERYEYRQAQDALAEAKIENLIYCPFCSIAYEIDKCAQVLDCPNPKCLKASCIKCKGLSHLPLRCEEVDKQSAEAALRREVEERMTKAVVRECNVCSLPIIKSDGCNVMTCRCGNQMCYICRQKTSFGHFCFCRPRVGEPGKPCPKCKKCHTYETEIEDNEALAAREEALNELAAINPELRGLEIGPPLEWVTRKTERQRDLIRVRMPCEIPPPEYKSHSYENKIEDNEPMASTLDAMGEDSEALAASVEALKEMVRMNRGLHDLDIGRPLNRLPSLQCEIKPPQEFNIQGDQQENRPCEIRHPQEPNLRVHQLSNRSYELRPPEEFSVHGYKLPNMVAPPRLLLTQLFEYGNQLANIPVPQSSPPRESLEHGGQNSNEGVPAPLPPKSS